MDEGGRGFCLDGVELLGGVTVAAPTRARPQLTATPGRCSELRACLFFRARLFIDPFVMTKSLRWKNNEGQRAPLGGCVRHLSQNELPKPETARRLNEEGGNAHDGINASLPDSINQSHG